MSEWKEVGLIEVCEKIGSGATPRGGKEAYQDSGISLIRSQNVHDFRFSEDGLAYIDEDQANKLKNVKVKENDVLVNITGDSVARVCSAPKEFIPARVNQHVAIIRPKKDHLDWKYLKYFLLSPNEKANLLMLSSSGATRNALTKGMLENLKINLPPLFEQKAIAHILGTLDEKIELNRQMNQSLEAMAQALFKSWFVDFDPVLDNALTVGNEIPEELQVRAEKRKGLSDSKKLLSTNPTLAAQFPDSFVFNETLGKWVPKGWEVKTIDDAATVVGGGTPSTKVEEYFCEKGIPWLSPKDLSGYEWKYISKGATDITEIGLKNSSAKLMPKGTVLFSSRAPIGYIAIAENEISTNQGFKSLVPDKGIPTEYLFQFLKANTDKIDSVASGSTFKEVSGSALKGIEIIIPSKQVLKEFSKVLSASNSRALVIQKETETLTQLRERLLPELISGRVRVTNENPII